MQTEILHEPQFERVVGTSSLEDKLDFSENVKMIPSQLFLLKDYLDKENNKLPIINELKDLIDEKEEWEQDGIPLKEKSVHSAINFVENSIVGCSLSLPILEVHSDGEVAFTWRKKERGIINISFDDFGMATWAAFLEIKQKQTVKGRFEVIDGIPSCLKDMIHLMTKVADEKE